MITFTNNDRILVLAPHPDDEAIATSGILQQALNKKLPVKIVYLTNGDNNEASFIVYEKHLVYRKEECIKMGEMRRNEAISAMTQLGLSKDNLIFLGYPDFGTMHIFGEHWGNTPPFKSMLTRSTCVPYPECLTPGAPYTGESILNDLKTVLLDFNPTIIFSPHPADLNVDHRSLFLFLQVALWDLEQQINKPTLYRYLVHAAHWPEPKGYFPDLEQTLPPALTNANLTINNHNLTKEEIDKKNKIVSCHKSQIEYNPPFLVSFIRKNELFSDYPHITLDTDKDSANPTCGTKTHSHIYHEDKPEEKHIKSVIVTKNNEFLLIKLYLHKLISKETGIRIHLYGYKKNTPFANMPKIHLHIGWRKEMLIFEKKNPLSVPEASFSLHEEGKEINVQFPLTKLNNPKQLFACARTHMQDLPLEVTAFRILKLK